MLIRLCRHKFFWPFSTPLNTWNRNLQQLQHLSTLYNPPPQIMDVNMYDCVSNTFCWNYKGPFCCVCTITGKKSKSILNNSFFYNNHFMPPWRTTSCTRSTEQSNFCISVHTVFYQFWCLLTKMFLNLQLDYSTQV